ncbi:MAG TPA: hypothetical protein VFY80_02560 [Burkholderiales bacterium]|nr:hypothetical protein [Burkholderiales bacterium]
MADKGLEERKAEAEARKAEADAKVAEAAALKAEREREEWESDLAKRARAAEQERIRAEAEEKVRRAGQSLGDALALQKLEADAKKSIAEADKATADAQRAQVSAFIPDFSKIEKGETTVTGDGTVLGSLLTPLAMEQAAKQVVGRLKLSERDRVLITTDADLASTDAVYVEVVTGLDLFTESAATLLGATPAEDRRRSSARDEQRRAAPAAVAGAIAAAVPGLISLFSANRTLSSANLTADTAAAVAAVAAHLTGRTTVQIDDFVVVQGGDVAAKEKALRQVRTQLVEHKLELEPPKKPVAEEQPLSVAAALIGQLITQIDAFLTSLHTSSGKRSPFAIAALRQQLHPSSEAGGPVFNKVLYIKASGATADKLLHDRPLWFKDKIQVIGSAAIVYWMMDTGTGNIIASGVGHGAVQIDGEIGDKLEFGKPYSLELT